MSNKVYSMLGLATKAGKLSSGDETCESNIKAYKAKVVIVAQDASDNTKKKFTDMCNYRKIPIRYFGEKDLLGRYTGKEIRAVITILDDNFAEKVLELIDGFEDLNGGGIIGENQSI